MCIIRHNRIMRQVPKRISGTFQYIIIIIITTIIITTIIITTIIINTIIITTIIINTIIINTIIIVTITIIIDILLCIYAHLMITTRTQYEAKRFP